MSTSGDHQPVNPENETCSFDRLYPNPPRGHTHVQQVAAGQLVNPVS
jgi:hypothetical protein